MLRRFALLATLLATAACKVADAPQNLEQLAVYAFANFDDARRLREAAETFPPLVAENLETLAEGYRVTDLTDADLEAAGVEDPDIAGIVGAMGTVTYQSALDDVLHIVTTEDVALRPGANVTAFDVLYSEGRDCFLARTCERYVQHATQTNRIGGLGDVTRTSWTTFQWGEDADGEPVVWQAVLSPDEAEISSDFVRMFQQYQVVLLYPDDGALRRVETFWVDAVVLGIEVPDLMLVNQAIAAMAGAAAQVDAHYQAD